jgi:hypothetical protein
MIFEAAAEGEEHRKESRLAVYTHAAATTEGG